MINGESRTKDVACFVRVWKRKGARGDEEASPSRHGQEYEDPESSKYHIGFRNIQSMLTYVF